MCMYFLYVTKLPSNRRQEGCWHLRRVLSGEMLVQLTASLMMNCLY